MRKLPFSLITLFLVPLLLSREAASQSLDGARFTSRISMGTANADAATGITRAKGVFGIGVVLGEPMGVSGKYWLSENTAIDGAFGYSFGDRFRVSMDYLIHTNAFDSPEFPLYYGVGGAIAGDRGYVAKSRAGDFALGARGVIGVSYLFRKAPLDAFLEVAPIVFVAPPLGLSIDFCFGIRVYP
jgi:hypothetical protein